jgi:transposase-like protein
MRGYSPETWEEARRLYVVERMAYRDVADAIGIAQSTLQKRGAREGWAEQRVGEMDYTARRRRLRNLALDRALKAINDPKRRDWAQDVYAWERVDKAGRSEEQQAQDERIRRQVVLDVVDALVERLGEVDRNLLTALTPHLPGLMAHLVGED